MMVPLAHASCIIVAWSKAAKLPTPQPSTISGSTSSKRYATTAEITTARDIVIMDRPPSPRYVSGPVTSTQFPGAEIPPGHREGSRGVDRHVHEEIQICDDIAPGQSMLRQLKNEVSANQTCRYRASGMLDVLAIEHR